MAQENYNALLQLRNLEREGYADQLKFEGGRLVNVTAGKSYGVPQVRSCKEYRFEGMSNPSDTSILFAIEFDDNRKGTLTAAYGPKGDADLLEFMNRLKC